jgi:hypothetical protein
VNVRVWNSVSFTEGYSTHVTLVEICSSNGAATTPLSSVCNTMFSPICTTQCNMYKLVTLLMWSCCAWIATFSLDVKPPHDVTRLIECGMHRLHCICYAYAMHCASAFSCNAQLYICFLMHDVECRGRYCQYWFTANGYRVAALQSAACCEHMTAAD